MRHNSIPLPTLNKKKLKKLVVKGKGKVVAVPVYLSDSDAIFKRNLKRSEDTSVSVFYLSECFYAYAYALFIEIISIFQILKEKDKSDRKYFINIVFSMKLLNCKNTPFLQVKKK